MQSRVISRRPEPAPNSAAAPDANRAPVVPSLLLSAVRLAPVSGKPLADGQMNYRIASAYAATAVVVFGVGYFGLGIREMGLYLFLLAVGFPASCAVVPLSEMVAPFFNSALGSGLHVWATLFASIVSNLALFAVGRALASAFSRWRSTSAN